MELSALVSDLQVSGEAAMRHVLETTFDIMALSGGCPMLKLPSEGQNFVKIREMSLLYVDKTEYIHRIVQSQGCVFLSRPRRFGKSLIVEAMAELLKGNRALFSGLWVDSSGYDFKEYPVV